MQQEPQYDAKEERMQIFPYQPEMENVLHQLVVIQNKEVQKHPQ